MKLVSTPDLVEAAVRVADTGGEHRRHSPASSASHRKQRLRGPWPWPRGAAGCSPRDRLPTTNFREALRWHGESARLFDRARTELVFGESLRRAGRRNEARTQLRAALEAFERAGATSWSERARSELRVSGATARKRIPSAIDQLTPQELQVTQFVADGATNKEVAARLFLSPRTIDYHLQRSSRSSASPLAPS